MAAILVITSFLMAVLSNWYITVTWFVDCLVHQWQIAPSFKELYKREKAEWETPARCLPSSSLNWSSEPVDDPHCGLSLPRSFSLTCYFEINVIHIHFICSFNPQLTYFKVLYYHIRWIQNAVFGSCFVFLQPPIALIHNIILLWTYNKTHQQLFCLAHSYYYVHISNLSMLFQ